MSLRLFDAVLGLHYVVQLEKNVNPLPLVSIVKNGLSHLSGVVTVPQMSIAMVRGIGCHLGLEQKLEFTKSVIDIIQSSSQGAQLNVLVGLVQILGWTNMRIQGNLANLTYNKENESLVCFDDVDFHDVNESVKLSSPPLVKTANVKQTLAHIEPWMKNAESFLLVGTEGCGKT